MSLSTYFKSKEFLLSIIYIPLYISLAFIKGETEIGSAIVSGVLMLILLTFLIKLSINFRYEDKKSKSKSFIRFLISNVALSLIIAIISIIIVQNCSGGLCGLAEAETFLLFI